MHQLLSTERYANFVTLNFAVENASIQPKLNKIKQEYFKDIEVPGFRKGKAPESVLEKHVDQEYLENILEDRKTTLIMYEVYPEVKKDNPEWLEKDQIVYEIYLPIDKITQNETQILFDLVVSTVPKVYLDELFKTRIEIKKSSEQELVEDGWLSWEDYQKQFFLEACSEFNLWQKTDKSSQAWDKVVVDYEYIPNEGKKETFFNEAICIDLDSETREFVKSFLDLKPGECVERQIPSLGNKNTKDILKIKCKEIYDFAYETPQQAIAKSSKFKKKFKDLANYNLEVKSGYEEQFEERDEMNFDDACTNAVRDYSQKMEMQIPEKFLELEAKKTLEKLKSISEFNGQSLDKTAQKEIVDFSEKKVNYLGLKEADLLKKMFDLLVKDYKREQVFNYISTVAFPIFEPKIHYQLIFKPRLPKLVLRSMIFSEQDEGEFNEQAEDQEWENFNFLNLNERNKFIKNGFLKNLKIK
jgi:trigger factor